MKNVAFALFLVPLPTYQRLPVLRPGATDQQPSLKVPMSGSAASELGSASETGIGTMATSICPPEGTPSPRRPPLTKRRRFDLAHHLVEVRRLKTDLDILPTVQGRRLSAPGVAASPPELTRWILRQSFTLTGTMHVAQRTVLGDHARSRLRRTDAWGVERHRSPTVVVKSDKPQFSISLRREDV
jgi:hypothetical protein